MMVSNLGTMDYNRRFDNLSHENLRFNNAVEMGWQSCLAVRSLELNLWSLVVRIDVVV